MILVDTSVWVDFFNGNSNKQVKLFESILLDDQIIIGDLIKIEILQGFRNDKDYYTALSLLDKFDLVNLVTPFSIKTSIELYRILRKKGITVRKTIDTIIAAYCIDKKIPLLTKDNDFIPFKKHFSLELL